MDTLRLFWAVTLPEEIRGKIAGVQAVFRKLPLNVKWVETENLHLTIRFIGATDKALVEPLLLTTKGRLAEISAFPLFLRRVGVFPSSKAPRVLWVGVEETASLLHLYRLVEEVVRSLGLPPDTKRFLPHVTLGRFRTGANGALLRQAMGEIGDVELGKVEVSGIELIASELKPSGPVYTPVGHIDFGCASG
ncbi:RNA 2',3'-cyclic phosphodiesterase [Thermodesulfitimonas sp.]